KLGALPVDDVWPRLLHEPGAGEQGLCALDLSNSALPVALQARALLLDVHHAGEWNVERGIAGDDSHGTLERGVRLLAHVHRAEPAAWQLPDHAGQATIELSLSAHHDGGGYPAPGVDAVLRAHVPH